MQWVTTLCRLYTCQSRRNLKGSADIRIFFVLWISPCSFKNLLIRILDFKWIQKNNQCLGWTITAELLYSHLSICHCAIYYRFWMCFVGKEYILYLSRDWRKIGRRHDQKCNQGLGTHPVRAPTQTLANSLALSGQVLEYMGTRVALLPVHTPLPLHSLPVITGIRMLIKNYISK